MSKETIIESIKNSVQTKELLLSDSATIELIQDMALACISCIESGGKVIFCGNGGSFGDSQHLSAEFTGKYAKDREPMASVALGTNSSSMSAIGNDYGYESVFSRELEAIGKKEDILICITTSGNSKNILEVLKSAEEMNIKYFILTGNSGGALKDEASCIKVPSDITGRIQESHIMIGQIVCQIVEESIFPN